ncbi:TasA family protein [Blastococcus xanthinilyticus]|uniref:Putative ribosomally synthesized peptide with SipW-like signal peptide n=1 Tax=Blastococcus xanthinilyticus TaxID=1564164 RepID=A0A5S5CQB3_9ACTN|nr:TasA family protein [Blastococcus xanthinilyticus]TYP82797.1 putative ribosomally synthesized peptide with SipW-like signal peptide [Blastococcus xanthinilyticus]
MSTKTTTTSSTARKVVGSLGVLGAAAAVAGMGTFGSFTDSTSVDTTITSGTVSIDLTQPAAAIPVTTAGFVPGDSLTRAVTLKNDGNTGLASVGLSATNTTSSVLTNGTANGLQLTVKSCDVAWVQGGTDAARTYTCASGEKQLSTGPVLAAANLGALKSLSAGGSDNLVFSISLPTAADNAFQGKTATLRLTFTGTQATGTAR